MVNNGISCIVITNGLNNKFLTKRTLTSILKTTDNIRWEVELILVDNSPGQNVKDILIDEGYAPIVSKRINVIHSTPNHLPKAFNRGIKEATKKYIAIFHDDCEILDKDWVKKFTNELNDNVYMVGPEIHRDIVPYRKVRKKIYFKEVPVVLERDKFLEMGGYDEDYYWGFEDVFFSAKIINKGKQIKHVPIDYIHFDGMSTILLQKKLTTTPKEFVETQNKFVKMKTKNEFTNFKEQTMGHTKVKIKYVTHNILLYLLLVIINKSFSAMVPVNLGTNLGYQQTFEYWKTPPLKIPTEVIVGLMPKTKNDMEVLMKDIKEEKNGELYSKLEKHKGELFKNYFGVI
jgi:glycosyltransferase involved in cell wall biosynthesis|tara:strand:+ start:1780 stop:2814 length:1035 start_codon:yes stop_codon:yes gene_type:complete